MSKWTINGALIFAFQGLMFALSRTYPAVDALFFVLLFGVLGAWGGAYLWRFLEQPIGPSEVPSPNFAKKRLHF